MSHIINYGDSYIVYDDVFHVVFGYSCNNEDKYNVLLVIKLLDKLGMELYK
jgi:hypothetical protein